MLDVVLNVLDVKKQENRTRKRHNEVNPLKV